MNVQKGYIVLLKDGRTVSVQHMHSGYYDYAMTGLTQNRETVYFDHDDIEEVLHD